MPRRFRTCHRPLTVVEEEFEVEVTMSCPACVNAFVGCRFSLKTLNFFVCLAEVQKLWLAIRTTGEDNLLCHLAKNI